MATRSLVRQTRSVPSIFEDMLTPFFESPFPRFLSQASRVLSVPAANIVENKDHYTISMAAPGMQKSDFNIHLEGSQITISAEKEEKKEEKGEKITRQEYSYSSFSRSFTLPEEVNREKIQAKYENGILDLKLPKKEEAVRKALSKDIKVQ